MYVRHPGANAHVFNAFNYHGRVIALDGQTGVYGTIDEVAEYAGYTGTGLRWGWLPTFP